MVRPERRVLLAGEGPARVSTRAPSSRPQPKGEILPARAGRPEPLKEKGALDRWGVGLAGTARAHGAADETGPFPRTVRFCKACEQETTQEIRSTGLVCLKCIERSVSADLDRD